MLAALAIPVVAMLRDDAAGERERAASARRSSRQAERVRQERDAVPVRATAPAAAAGRRRARAPRRRSCASARPRSPPTRAARVAEGTLKGDHKGTACEVFPETDARRAAEDDPATQIGRYDCVAYTSEFEPGYTGRTTASSATRSGS